MEFDFDKVYDRRNTNSLKWDKARDNHHGSDELPMWVADMDFPSPEPIRRALIETAEKGFFGYTVDKRDDRQIISDWLLRRHGYAPDPDDIALCPGVVFALTAAILAFTAKDDAVMISEPVYYPFSSMVKDTQRKLVRNELVKDINGRYSIDFDAFESQITQNEVKLYILCSPHNPVGRVWTKEELERIGNICLDHEVLVVSDEIHADFTFENHRHIPFFSVSPKYEKEFITVTSPSKTFNMAGLQIAEVYTHDERKLSRLVKAMAATGYSEISVTGLAAMKAAYTQCDDWVDAVVRYIYDNAMHMESYLREELPMLKMTHPEGTYLTWVDFSALGLNRFKLEDLIRNDAKLWLDAGFIFGDSGAGFERFNVACPRATLDKALTSLHEAILK